VYKRHKFAFELFSKRFWLARILLQMRLLCWTLSIVLGGGYITIFKKLGLTSSSDGMGWGVGVDARLAGPLEGVGVYHWRPGLRRQKHERSHF